MYVEADPSGADGWKLEPVVELLKEGAVGVIPTDTVYATAICLLHYVVRYFKAVLVINVLCFFIRAVSVEGWEAIVVNLYFCMQFWVILSMLHAS